MNSSRRRWLNSFGGRFSFVRLKNDLRVCFNHPFVTIKSPKRSTFVGLVNSIVFNWLRITFLREALFRSSKKISGVLKESLSGEDL